jgi:transglutaminase-like putative cysteine protease
MRKTLIGFGLSAAVLIVAWTGLETGPQSIERAILMALLALLPVLAVALGRRLLVIAAATALSLLVAVAVAVDLPLSNARPFDPHDFFGPALTSLRKGVLGFFDTRVPFEAAALPDMHALVLLGIFGFSVAVGIAIATRRTFLAVGLLAAGCGWPTTMLSLGATSDRDLVLGALILATALVLLVVLRPGSRSLVPATVLGVALVVVAVGGATTDAVAKGGFVNWSRWDPYDRPDDPVSVGYVWDGNYNGISFPEKRTVVLRVKTSGPQRYLYWRATTLDSYSGTGWRESLERTALVPAGETVDVAEDDPLLPRAAKNAEELVRQDVTVEALSDSRLLGSPQAVRWDPSGRDDVVVSSNGTVAQSSPLGRGEHYAVFSYVPKQARPKPLAEAGTSYPNEIHDYLLAQPELDVTPLPTFGDPGRDEFMESLFGRSASLEQHRPLYETARDVTAGQDTPYEATVALLAWFRGEGGGFTYTEQPLVELSKPPLVSFLETRQGYCQHFAGAMALMLRYLGIPSRVAVGFTTGTYNSGRKEWVVTDHNAHAWVEVFFPGFGWLQFDPTPGRGQLDAAFDPFSTAFDAREAAQLGQTFLDIPEVGERAALLQAREAQAGGSSGVVPGAVSKRNGNLLGLVLLVIVGAALAVVVLKWILRRIRLLPRDPRAVASACRRDLAGYLADQGRDVPSSATPRELGDLAQQSFGVDASLFVSALATARYAPPAAAAGGARRARNELRSLRRGLGRSNGIFRRLRGAVSLRSLTV